MGPPLVQISPLIEHINGETLNSYNHMFVEFYYCHMSKVKYSVAPNIYM